jgi:hypothetical protein
MSGSRKKPVSRGSYEAFSAGPSANRVSTDTGGEFIFAVLTKLTTGVFKHLLKVNQAYFSIRHQYQNIVYLSGE